MTRPDASSEPSMEDILASIRKIIAEDPAGARPAPPPRPLAQPQNAPSPYSAFIGERAAAQPTTPQPGAAQPSKAAEAIPAGRVLPSFPTFESANSAPQRSAPLAADSIEAQLSDLLGSGDALKSRTAAPAPAITQPASQPSAPAANSEPAKAAPAEPKFTVSRDGFVPPAAAPAKAAPIPFDFDLGPSPFAKKPEVEAGKRPAAAISDAAIDDVLASFGQAPAKFDPLGARREPAPEKSAPAAPEQISSPSAVNTLPPGGATPKAEAKDVKPVAAPVANAELPKPTVEPKTVTPLAAPSLSATLPPSAEEIQKQAAKAAADKAAAEKATAAAQRALEQERIAKDRAAREKAAADRAAHAAAKATASVATGKAVPETLQDVVTEAIAAAPKAAKLTATESSGAPVAVEVDDRPSHALARYGSTLPALRDGETGVRTMEDTVADLLRPMLKSWLAENMPKIIERALRREISEMNLSEHVGQHKTAAE